MERSRGEESSRMEIPGLIGPGKWGCGVNQPAYWTIDEDVQSTGQLKSRQASEQLAASQDFRALKVVIIRRPHPEKHKETSALNQGKALLVGHKPDHATRLYEVEVTQE